MGKEIRRGKADAYVQELAIQQICLNPAKCSNHGLPGGPGVGAAAAGVFWSAGKRPATSAGTGAAGASAPERRRIPENDGQDAGGGARAFPTPLQMGQAFVAQLSDPFSRGPSRTRASPSSSGIRWRRVARLFRWPASWRSAGLRDRHVAHLLRRALDPFIPGAQAGLRRWPWMPLALTIRTRRPPGIFIDLHPVISGVPDNTAFDVGQIKREWLNVAATLMNPLRKAFHNYRPQRRPS
jgi:hypothetical protein